MMKKAGIYIGLFFLLFLLKAEELEAQVKRTVSASSYPAYTENGDTLPVVVLADIIVFPRHSEHRSPEEELRYRRLVRDVKRTLPYAKMIYATLIETYEYIETLPTEKEKKNHLSRMENELFQEYKPVLKKMTLSQGKLLIRLVDRECNQTSFSLVTAVLGSFRANFWNIFAGLFGASLKSEYDPEGKDAAVEKVVVLVENGLI